MITGKSLDELESILERATKKAKEVNPEIIVVSDCSYKVQGSKFNYYEVVCGRMDNQDWFIACVCRAALEQKGCYHAAAAFLKHKTIAMENVLRDRQKAEQIKANQEMDNAIYRKPQAKDEKVGGFRL